MMEVQEYIAHVQDNIIPNNMRELQQCKTAKEITQWRKSHFKTLTDTLAAGEHLEQPQDLEESKEEISFSQRIYMAAKKLEQVEKSQTVENQIEINKARQAMLEIFAAFDKMG